MKYRELKININKDYVDAFFSFLEECSITNYYEVLFDLEDTSRGTAIIKDDTIINIYLEETDIDNELKVYIYLQTFVSEKYFMEKRIIESKEYEEAYKEFYKPFIIGTKFLLVPSWEKEDSTIQEKLQKENLTPLYLNPGLAFGTGHHETTKLMVERMETIINSGMKIVDMGCGSGVLSIAAMLLGAEPVYCYDIDFNAVKATESNIKDNPTLLQKEYHVFLNSFTDPLLSELTFDIFLANITFSVLSSNISSIAKLKTNRFLFSGLLKQKVEDLKKILQKNIGGEFVYSKDINDWAIVEWAK
jgi:ribosomal protein L11 methyltransferase